MDGISYLPEPIVHHILYLLNPLDDGPPVELVRMSVLSKKWFHLTASFPFLDFTIRNFTSRQSFFKYFEYTTSRFCRQNLTTRRLRLSATLVNPAEVDTVDRCLELLLRNGVKELVIHIPNSSDFPTYRLPNILLSVSVLESLTIHHCDLPSSLMFDTIVKLKSLIYLELGYVHLADEVIKYLTTGSPLLQSVSLTTCSGFRSFCVHGHQNLQKVRIDYNIPVETIDIEAPNLSHLMVADWDGIGAPRMNLASCKKLTTVTYIGHPLPNSNDFTDFLSQFPFVENMYLATKYKCNNLKLSSQSLRTLVLHSVCDLEEIELSTPNLVLYGYPCNYTSFWAFRTAVRHATHLKACMQCYYNGYIATLWFQKLRQFLDKIKGFKVLNLYIYATYSQKFTGLDKLKAIELPPYELEHVELQLETHGETSAHIAFVNAVLWCCRPRSLTLRSSFSFTNFEEQSDLVKFTYEKLLEQEDQCNTHIQIVWPSSLEAQKHFSGLMCEGKTVSFVKKDVVQEEAG